MFMSTSAFANGTSTHPGANPPGNGWGCHNNPGKSDCHKPDKVREQQPIRPSTPAPPSNNGGAGGNGGDGGTGYGGHGSAEAAAKAWQTMNSTQRAELNASLSGEQRQEMMNTINLKNENKWENNSPSSATSSTSLTGNTTTTTTTIGGTTYSFNQPVASAFVQLPPGITPAGPLIITMTGCGPDFAVNEVRKVQATTNVAMGLFTSTRDNGVVAKTVPGTVGLVYGDWVVSGREGDQLIEERTVNGFQAVIYAYLAGSSASSGLSLNGQNGSGAVTGSGGIQTFGKEVDKLPCSFKETRKLTPVKVASADDIADAVASRMSVRQKLSAPTHERTWVSCPKEGCKAPKNGYYRYERKDGSVEASTEITTRSRKETVSEKPLTGPEIRAILEKRGASRP